MTSAEATPTPPVADAFDVRAAAAADRATALLVAGAMQSATPGRRALGLVILALADARDRPAGDDAILADVDRARGALGDPAAIGCEQVAGLVGLVDELRELALRRAARPAARDRDHDARSPCVQPASVGTPAIHRGVLLEAIAEVIPPRAFGALRPREDRPPPSLEQVALRRWGRDMLEEVALAGRLRRPGDEERWVSGRGFEVRLLDALDALAALGRGRTQGARLDVADLVRESLATWSIPDPGRTFAAAFVLACLDGYGAAARLDLLCRAADAATVPAVEDALALGSSPRVDDVLASLLCEDDSPRLLALALRAARRRRRVPASFAVPLLDHPDDEVAIAAARSCAVLAPEDVSEPLEIALASRDPVAAHAAESLMVLGAPASSWTRRVAALAGGDPGAPATSHAVRLLAAQARVRELHRAHGQPLGAATIVAELAHPATAQGARTHLALELTLAWPRGGRVPRPMLLEVDDWIDRQTALLGQAERFLAVAG